jgi:DNA ligase (NAD+)
VGDFVFVEKAGEIIPAIIGVNQARRTADLVPYAFPVSCPVCRSSLVQAPGEVAVSCPNYDCPAQVRKRVEYFASDAGVGISGLGPATVEKLVDRGWVANVADLYRLRREDLLTLGDNVGKSTDRLLAAIEQSKRAELWRFINGLGIPEVGAVTARELAEHFGGLEPLAAVRKEDLLEGGRPVIPGVGQSAALAILAYFEQPAKRAVVTDLVALGVKPRSVTTTPATDGALAGKIFVLTGTLPHLTRAEATAKIVAAGGTVAASVTQRTDFVLAGEGGGAKLDAARSLGVQVIEEAEFARMLGAPAH